MSGGLMRNHDKCKRNKKYDPDKEICIVCGWAQKVHKNKLTSYIKNTEEKDNE